MLNALDALWFKDEHWGMQLGVCLCVCMPAHMHADMQQHAASSPCNSTFDWIKLGQMLSITELAPLLHANPTGRQLQLVMKDKPLSL